MERSKHLKIAGALQIVQSFTLIAFASRYLIPYVRELQEGSQALDDRMLILALILLCGACQLWFGISLIMQKQWTTHVVGFIFCALGFLGFPVGTAISGYTLWAVIVVRGEDAKVTEQGNGEVREKAGKIE